MESWRKVALAGMVGMLLMALSVFTQPVNQESTQMTGSGQMRAWSTRRITSFAICPVSSFPELPAEGQDLLNQRGCMIPQTYAAHHPENVVHASLERAGSSDWAVLCSTKGKVPLL